MGHRLRAYAPSFLSTLSLRRATVRWQEDKCITLISIHALLAESDIISIALLILPIRFLSTLSLRRATTMIIKDTMGITAISIHALLAESDGPQNHQGAFRYHFYPRSPCGERPAGYHGRADRPHFYPRSPCGERPYGALKHVHQKEISIHALLAESDTCKSVLCGAPSDFYPRSPCGERPLAMAGYTKAEIISIHALLAESDSETMLPSWDRYTFLSTLSLRRATSAPYKNDRGPGDFYPRSPCGERPQHN